MVEHDLAKVGVASSSLVSRSNHLQMTFCCGNSSVGRARPCQGRGREFESRFPLQSLFKFSIFPPKLTNSVSPYNRSHIQLVEHDPRLPRLGSRVRVSFPAPISLRSFHNPFELPFTSRCDALSYLAFTQRVSATSPANRKGMWAHGAGCTRQAVVTGGGRRELRAKKRRGLGSSCMIHWRGLRPE